MVSKINCCIRRRPSTQKVVIQSSEFKPLTPEYLEHVRKLVTERAAAEKEYQKKRAAARKLRRQIEQRDSYEDGSIELQFNPDEKGDPIVDVESLSSEQLAKNEEDARNFKDAQRLEKQGETKRMEAGRKLSPKYAADFQKQLVGIPLVDIDPFYKEKEVFIVIGKDHTIFRFSAHDAFFCMSPFHPLRRFALKTLVHPLFTMIVMLTIITNCVFMAMNKEIVQVEYTFTAVYTIEFVVKALARGFILTPFTYLRDPWNWLDFLVIGLAYVMLLVENIASGSSSDALGNVAALRTFRVLRALKTVAVVPGLKTIVGALMEAVIKMRDVGILTIFMLSIFALIGLQLYMGSLSQKCVRDWDTNLTESQIESWKNDISNWLPVKNDDHRICGEGSGAGKCPENYTCLGRIGNPNFGYTSWDNFGICMLNSYRIMTQDGWENLYFITIRANGSMHFFFFVLFILLGSFYLVNLILATVAMAYNAQQERDLIESQAEENEKKEQQDLIMNSPIPPEIQDNQSRKLSIMDNFLSPTKATNNTDRHSLSTIVSEKEGLDKKGSLNAPTEGSFKKNSALGSLIYSLHLPEVNHNQEDCVSRVNPSFDGEDEEDDNLFTETDGLLVAPSITINEVTSPADEEKKVELYPPIDSEATVVNGSSHYSLTANGDKQSNKGSRHNSVDIQSRNQSLRKEHAEASRKELLKARLKSLCCSWTCCPCFHRTQKYLDLFVNDAFMDVFIMLCILCNTLFMAMEHHGQSEKLTYVLRVGNYFFTAVFSLECFFKLTAMGPVKYFRQAWNSFDFVVVAFSLFELLSEMFGASSIGGLSVLRSFRLLRVLKLAKSWKTLNLLMVIVARSLGALGNLTIILAIIVFIFAVMGIQLFAKDYEVNGELFFEEANTDIGIAGRTPRWNFKDFPHAFLMVFRVLCGEWIESMWNCMRASNQYICVPFFLLTQIIGNMVVLNLFLVLLLSSFSSDALTDSNTDEHDIDKITEAKGRVLRLVSFIKKLVAKKICSWKAQRKEKPPSYVEGMTMTYIEASGNGVNGHSKSVMEDSQTPILFTLENVFDEPETSMAADTGSQLSLESLDDAAALSAHDHANNTKSRKPSVLEEKNRKTIDTEWAPEGYKPTMVVYEAFPGPCCFPFITNRVSLPCVLSTKRWWALRCFTFRLVEHKYFEGFIIACILLSSLSLALEDIYLEQRFVLKFILNFMDKIFTAIFICEMLIKWLAFGFHKYFTDAWCWLDFVIVGISITSLIMESAGLGGMSAFKAMRTLRALRPLRAISRWEGMRVVVNALFQAVPSISNVLLVILIFWLIFAIMGVNFFSGKFYKCVDSEGRYLHIYYRSVNESSKFNYVKDVLNVTTKADCVRQGYSWENSKINFDNVGNAYLALLQVAIFQGWLEIMSDAMDSTDIDVNPVFENNTSYCWYFVFFVIFGSFFTLNMFIGVIIDNFNAQKKKAGGSIEMFMTEDQKKYYNAMKKLSGKGPAKAVSRPKWWLQGLIFDFTMNHKFDLTIMVFILLNMITMCMEYDDQSKEFTEILEYVNIIFIVVFAIEAVLKIIALRQYYFKFPWNLFDFLVVVLSILGVAFNDAIEQYLNLSPTVLRVIRVFRVGRVLRLVKSAKGIRTLLFSLLVSLPALFNIGLLLFLIMFIYSTFGMAFFSRIKYTAGIDQVFNFETFFQALMTLFQCVTSAGWNGILTAVTNTDDCDGKGNGKTHSNCGEPTAGLLFMVSYLLLAYLVIINMYIAVILENFSQATEDIQQGITEDDIETYYELWGTFDPKATKYIPANKLSDFVDELEAPLHIPKPNFIMLVMTDIPVCEGDRIHCRDILDVLTRLFLKQDPAVDSDLPQAEMDDKYGDDYNPLFGMLERQRRRWAAQFICRWYIARRQAQGRPLTHQTKSSLPEPIHTNKLTKSSTRLSIQSDSSSHIDHKFGKLKWKGKEKLQKSIMGESSRSSTPEPKRNQN